MAYQSVYVSATRVNGGGVTYLTKGSPNATLYSVYLRETAGALLWQEDFPLDQEEKALAAAAELSMINNVPVEPLL